MWYFYNFYSRIYITLQIYDLKIPDFFNNTNMYIQVSKEILAFTKNYEMSFTYGTLPT